MRLMHDDVREAGSLSWLARVAKAFRVGGGGPWLPFAAVVIAFGVDLITPLATTDFYLVTILLCLRARSPRIPLYTAALSTPFAVIGYFLAPNMGAPIVVALINRAFTILLLWVGALMTAKMMQRNAALSETQAKAWSSERRFRLI